MNISAGHPSTTVGSSPTKKQEVARTCRPDAGESLQANQDRTYEL